MYNFGKIKPTTLKQNTAYQGERLEEKINRILNNKEPITDGAPIVYTARKDGVRPEYNIRTDRWEIALEAMDSVSRQHVAKREANIKDFENKLNKANEKLNKETGGQSIQGTNEKQ